MVNAFDRDAVIADEVDEGVGPNRRHRQITRLCVAGNRPVGREIDEIVTLNAVFEISNHVVIIVHIEYKDVGARVADQPIIAGTAIQRIEGSGRVDTAVKGVIIGASDEKVATVTAPNVIHAVAAIDDVISLFTVKKILVFTAAYRVAVQSPVNMIVTSISI